MGLFLQKTNIIRDYLEDVRQGRHFWPRQVNVVYIQVYYVNMHHYCVNYCGLRSTFRVKIAWLYAQWTALPSTLYLWVLWDIIGLNPTHLKVKGQHLYTATYMNMTSSGLQCEVAY